MGDESRRADETRLLIVDDDLHVLSVLQRALQAPGVTVVTAATGAIALVFLTEGSFDAIVCDIQMPGISGLGLLRAVREHDLDLPIVLMTGQPDLKGAAAAIEYGAFQYLIKPIVIERLRSVVDRAVNIGRIARLKRQCADDFGSGSFYVGDRAGMDAKLDRALLSLRIEYQPIVRAQDEQIYAREAFLRSEEPALPHPSAVLRAAARVGRIHDVGRAVRDRVAADALQTPLARELFFVNLHHEDLLDPALYIPSAGLSRMAAQVVFELTDRAVVDDVPDVEARIARLRALRFRIAIDNMGAGHTGVGVFDQIEPEFVKLDMSVVRGVHLDSSKQGLVRSMVQLCHKMGKYVIAQGVETAAESVVLREAGCDFLQGFLFGRPGPLLGGVQASNPR